MPKYQKLSKLVKQIVVGNQHYRCANKPNSKLANLENYLCPMWDRKNIDHKGNFDASGYDLVHIDRSPVTSIINLNNLYALCKCCHSVKIHALLHKAEKSKQINYTKHIDDDSDDSDDDDIDNLYNHRHKCDRCPLSFYHQANLRKHIETTVCGKTFTRSIGIPMHITSCEIKINKLILEIEKQIILLEKSKINLLPVNKKYHNRDLK